MEDIQRYNGCLSDQRILLSGILVKQRFNNKVNIRIIDVRKSKRSQNTLFGFGIIDQLRLRLVLLYEGDKLLLTFWTHGDDRFRNELTVLLAFAEHSHEDWKAFV